MKTYKVKIGYTMEFEVTAENRKEAEEYAWFEYDQQDTEPKMKIKEIKK